ncbi:hypothetical protein P8M98_003502 [Escherichia coli]|nr:hypothetical protein [Escherichia coli]EKR5636840.1 hypothetical protein [Escherichia coli]HCT7898569.1 hypothetical protein [Enterobacter cloacae]
MDVSAFLRLRDFSDLTGTELMARVKHLEILRERVTYSHDHFSPRQLRAFGLATLMLFTGFVFTDSLLFSAVTGLITLTGVLRYSRLPMTWDAQLIDGVSRLEPLRSSPLRMIADEPDTRCEWHFASCCLAAEIELIHAALSQPVSPFSA